MGYPLTTLTYSDTREGNNHTKTRTDSLTLTLIFTLTHSNRHRARPKQIILTIRENCFIHSQRTLNTVSPQTRSLLFPTMENKSFPGVWTPGIYHKKFSPGFVLSHSFQMKKWKTRGFPGRVVVHHQFEPHITRRIILCGVRLAEVMYIRDIKPTFNIQK